MAKITESKGKDSYPFYLYIVPIILIAWFSIAAQISNYWYYLGALVISHMWGTASFERTPKAYNNKIGSARMSFIMTGISLALFISLVTLIIINPNLFLEILGSTPESTPLP